MSFDRQLDQICPHQVVEEALFVLADANEDRRVVRPIRPISAFNSVKVRLNSLINVPSEGVGVPAVVEGTAFGPFNITSSSNTLILKVGEGADQTIVLPTANRLSSAKIADLLSSNLTGVAFSITSKNQIQMRSLLSGREAKVWVKTGSTLATLLGIPVNRKFQGRQIAPGWTLVSDPTSLPDRPTRLIVFDEILKGFQDFVEINYTTVRQECRRCGGLGVEFDWRYGIDGNVAEVRDEALLLQESQKVVFTVRGSDPFNPWYGSTLMEQIGSKMGNTALTQHAITTDIYTTFQNWQSIKKAQEEKVGQFVSDEEYPARILSIDLQQSNQDPTIVFITILLQNRSSKPITLERGLKLPQPFNLLGPTAAQGVFRQSLRNFALVE